MNNPLNIIQEFYAHLTAGDAPAALALLGPEIEWTEAKGSPYYGGTWTGVEAVVTNLLQPLQRDVEGFEALPHTFLDDGARVAAFGHYSGLVRSTNRILSAPFVHDWNVAEGRISHFIQHTDTVLWRDAFSDSGQ